MRRISTQRDTFARHIEAADFDWRPAPDAHDSWDAPLENGHSLHVTGFGREDPQTLWAAHYRDGINDPEVKYMKDWHPVPNPEHYPKPGHHFYPSREHAMQAAEEGYRKAYPIGTDTGGHDSGVDYSDLNAFKRHLGASPDWRPAPHFDNELTINHHTLPMENGDSLHTYQINWDRPHIDQEKSPWLAEIRPHDLPVRFPNNWHADSDRGRKEDFQRRHWNGPYMDHQTAMDAVEDTYQQEAPKWQREDHGSGVDYSDLNSFKKYLSWYKHAISQEDFENYRTERHRQEVELEGQTGGYGADKADYFARGGKPLLTLKDYMKGLKVGPAEQAARQEPVSHEVYTPDPNDWGGGPAW